MVAHVELQKERGPESIFLMAEEDPLDAELFSRMLYEESKGQYRIICVENFHDTMLALQDNSYSALILDYNLSNNGPENIKQLTEKHPDLPIIVLTGKEDREFAIDTLQLGVQDYLSKNDIDADKFVRALRYATERKNIETELKSALRKIASQSAALEQSGTHDALTQLPNRSYLLEQVEHSIQVAKRHNKAFGLLYIDLDKFKNINVSYGHNIGDRVLVQVAQKVKNALRQSDTIARIGGDEFIVLTDLLNNGVQAYTIANAVYQSLSQPLESDHCQIHIRPCIGIATYPESGCTADLIKHADLAMLQAKEQSDKVACFFTHYLEKQRKRIATIEQEISEALYANRMHTVYQPIYDTQQKILAVESLSRWCSDTLGEISPEEYIPVIENGNLANQLTRQTLEKIKNDFYKNDGGIVRININISAKQLMNNGFANFLLQQMKVSEIPAERLCLEITERQMISNVNTCLSQLKLLKDQGIQIALDDFGTGFSSITHLKELPIDFLKIDRSLVNDIHNNNKNTALTAGIIEMAHRLHMRVIGEGIEKHEEFAILKDLECDEFQGFLFSKPVTIEKLSL